MEYQDHHKVHKVYKVRIKMDKMEQVVQVEGEVVDPVHHLEAVHNQILCRYEEAVH